jgi:FMN phosphatase YigB (HAD superfamily)
MKIFVDFDDVLFNTKKFKENFLKKVFIRNGITEEIFNKYYYQRYEDGVGKEVMRYDFERQLQKIEKEINIDTKKIEKEFRQFLNDTSEYVFSDVGLFFEKFKKNELFVISFSDTQFQKIKIGNSKISKYVKKINITNGDKSQEILEIIKKEKIKDEDIFFIDDRAEYITEVKKKIPQVKTILMRRKEGRYKNNENKNCDFIVKNLEEVLKIIHPME